MVHVPTYVHVYVTQMYLTAFPLDVCQMIGHIMDVLKPTCLAVTTEGHIHREVTGAFICSISLRTIPGGTKPIIGGQLYRQGLEDRHINLINLLWLCLVQCTPQVREYCVHAM